MTVRASRSLLLRRWLAAAMVVAAPPALGSCMSFDDAVATEGYFDLAGAARVCARVFSCPGLATSLRRSLAAPIDGANFSTCMSWLAGPTPSPPGGFAAQAAILAQVGAAASCDAAASGLDVVPLPADYPGCVGGASGGCTADGDVFDCAARQITRCPGSQHVSGSTCDAASLTCVAACATTFTEIGACATPSGPLCEDPTPREEIDCSAFGEGCVSPDVEVGAGIGKHMIHVSLCSNDNTDPAICAGAEGAARCTGGALVVCAHLKTVASATLGSISFGAVEILYQCSEVVGSSCANVGAGSLPFCERPDAQCSPTDPGVNTCDGDVLVACVAGRSQHIDCSAAGATCQPATAATSGAFCAFGS